MLTYGFPLAIIGMALKVKILMYQLGYLNMWRNMYCFASLLVKQRMKRKLIT